MDNNASIILLQWYDYATLSRGVSSHVQDTTNHLGLLYKFTSTYVIMIHAI